MRSILPPWYWIVVVGLLALPLAIKWFVKWILAPIIIHRRQTIATRPDNRMAEPEALTPEIAELTAALVSQFKAEGFEFQVNKIRFAAILRAARMAKFAHQRLPRGIEQRPLESLALPV